MFRRGAGSPQTDDDGPKPEDMLREAVDRNAAAGIVRQELLGVEPPASGRLIEWDDRGVRMESVQVIGREVRLVARDKVYAFIAYRGEIISFEASAIELGEAQKLNDRVMINTLLLSPPRKIEFGNRRTAFRSPLSVFGGEFPMRMWFLDRGQIEQQKVRSRSKPRTPYPDGVAAGDDAPAKHRAYFTSLTAALASRINVGLNQALVEDDEEATEQSDDANPDASHEQKKLANKNPEPEPTPDWPDILARAGREREHALARLVDITPNGLGLTLYNVSASQLQLFERIVLKGEVMGELLEVVGEVRRATDLSHSRCKVGLLLIYPAVGDLRTPLRRSLESVYVAAQREAMRLRAERGAA